MKKKGFILNDAVELLDLNDSKICTIIQNSLENFEMQSNGLLML